MIELELHKQLNSAHGNMNLNIKVFIKKGEFITLYGPSGAGKTSILKMIAGLLSPSEGNIIVNGKSWFNSEKKTNLSPQKRNVGFVFQNYALFPNMSVAQNLKYAQQVKDHSFYNEIVDMLEINHFLDQNINLLSGGQQQRISIGRALLNKPEILLLDEPLSALDVEMRSKLQDYLKAIHKKFGITTVLVSHDPGEILKLSSKVIELREGKINRVNHPQVLFGQHKISGKFQFIGEIVSIEKADVVAIASILIGSSLSKIIVSQEEEKEFSVGDKVLVATKAFNPVIQKIER